MNRTTLKVLIIFLLISIFLLFNYADSINLEYIKSQQAVLNAEYLKHQNSFIIIFFLIYVLITTLSLPIATLLSLLAGSIFGLFKATIIIAFASTIGATLAMLISRYLFRDFFENRYKKQFETVNKAMSKNEGMYLFSLRLAPIFPFFLINSLMGLTRIATVKFFIVSFFSMLPGIVIYTNAGQQLGSIQALSEVASLRVLISLVMIGFLPFIGKMINSKLNLLK